MKHLPLLIALFASMLLSSCVIYDRHYYRPIRSGHYERYDGPHSRHYYDYDDRPRHQRSHRYYR